MTGRGDSGFTLVETLVALVMLTMSIVAAVQIFGIGSLGIRSSDQEAIALHMARSHLVRAGAETLPIQGRYDGVAENGMQWTVAVEAYEPPRADGEARPMSRAGAYWITSEVRWKPSAFAAPLALRLQTLRVAPP